MFVDPVRMVADALEDGTIGVNARLAALDLDPGDPAPANVTVFDATRDFDVAMGRLPDTRPCVCVSLYRATQIDPFAVQGAHRDYHPELLIRIGDNNSEAQVGVRDRDATLRAILQCLDTFHDDGHVAMRTRNSVQLVCCEDVSLLAAFSPVDNGELTAAFLVRYLARDLQI